MPIDGTYKPTEQELELLQRWYAPDLTTKTDSQRTNALGMNVAKLNSGNIASSDKVTVEDVEHTPTQLSAQDLDAITQQAEEQGFEEGLAKGREQGLANGYEEGFSQGLEQGIEQGTKQGLEQAQQQIDEKLQFLTQLIEQFHHPIAHNNQLIEHSLVNLSLTLAKKVIQCEISQSSEPLYQAVSQGINLLGSQYPVTIKLCAEDLEHAHTLWDEQTRSGQKLTFVHDATIAKGSCLLESSASSVSFDLERRCAQVFDDFVAQERPQALDVEEPIAQESIAEQEPNSSTNLNSGPLSPGPLSSSPENDPQDHSDELASEVEQ